MVIKQVRDDDRVDEDVDYPKFVLLASFYLTTSPPESDDKE